MLAGLNRERSTMYSETNQTSALDNHKIPPNEGKILSEKDAPDSQFYWHNAETAFSQI